VYFVSTHGTITAKFPAAFKDTGYVVETSDAGFVVLFNLTLTTLLLIEICQ
jgi:hypothetical protein